MAKAKAPSRPDPRRLTPPKAERGNYFVEVYQELRKVSWPKGNELRRMTSVVVLTVLIFSLIIGGVDLILSIIVKPLYK